LTFYPKANALVVNERVFDDLDYTNTVSGGESCFEQRTPDSPTAGGECGPYRIVGHRLIMDSRAAPSTIYR
jgi:hypothetical protein